MNRKLRLTTLLVPALISTACSSSDTYVVEETDADRTAVITGSGPAKRQGADDWTNTVTTINGKSVPKSTPSVRIAPGTHRLTLRCSKSAAKVLESEVELDVVAGAQYRVGVDFGRQRCVIFRHHSSQPL